VISTTLGFIPLKASCRACVVNQRSLMPIGPRRGGIAGHCQGGGKATSTAVAGHQPLYTRSSTGNLCTPVGPRRGGIAGPRTRGAGEGKHICAPRLLLDCRHHSLPLVHNCAPYLGAVLPLFPKDMPQKLCANFTCKGKECNNTICDFAHPRKASELKR
jgi:hypothetical protein